jgi:hypothetical protein
LWIVKNRAEPGTRLGFEPYSYHAQYNLLPMAMLAIAYGRADDSIAERPSPAEVGGYVFDLREDFHKVAAAAGGYYVLIDTSADPHYNATGLQRVHRAGVAFPPLSDSTAAERAFGPDDAAKGAMTPGLQWKPRGDADGSWRSLADYELRGKGAEGSAVQGVTLDVSRAAPAGVSLKLDYTLGASAAAAHLVETYTLSAAGVECANRLSSGPTPLATRVRLPALVSDGAQDTSVEVEGARATVANRGSVLTYQIVEPANGVTLGLEGADVFSHNGRVRALVASLPDGGGIDGDVRWTIALSQSEVRPK